jgi:hypothetical protein
MQVERADLSLRVTKDAVTQKGSIHGKLDMRSAKLAEGE